MKRVITVAIIALFSIIGFTIPASAQIHPLLSGGNYTFQETNGSYYLSSATLSAGNPMSEETFSRTITFTAVTTYKGRNAGYLQLSNGNFVAATTSCDNLTIKLDATSFGTVFAPKNTGDPNGVFLVNRGCDQNAGSKDTVYAGGQNNGSIFFVCDSAGGGCHGLFTKLTHD